MVILVAVVETAAAAVVLVSMPAIIYAQVVVMVIPAACSMVNTMGEYFKKIIKRGRGR